MDKVKRRNFIIITVVTVVVIVLGLKTVDLVHKLRQSDLKNKKWLSK